jgi:hypothetical protein
MCVVEDMIKKYRIRCSDVVADYAKDYVDVIYKNETILDFFIDNNIPIFDFINEFICNSQKKYDKFGDPVLSQEEMNSLVRNVIISNEFAKLLLEDHISITSINSFGTLNYKLDDYALGYFKKKFGVDFSEINEEVK